MQIETEKRMVTLIEQSARLHESMATLADGMARMTRIVLDHDDRIEKLEGEQPQ